MEERHSLVIDRSRPGQTRITFDGRRLVLKDVGLLPRNHRKFIRQKLTPGEIVATINR